MKIAIMGSHKLNTGAIPKDYIKWGFNRYIHEATYWFDVHKLTCINLTLNSVYGKFLFEKGNKAFLAFNNKYLPQASHFPWEKLVEKHGRIFTNTIDWLIAYAITLEPDIILLEGITIHPEDNHAFCRPGNEYFIGFARGQGIRVKIPSYSWLCRPGYITPEYEIGLQHGKGLSVDKSILDKTILFNNKKLYGVEQ